MSRSSKPTPKPRLTEQEKQDAFLLVAKQLAQTVNECRQAVNECQQRLQEAQVAYRSAMTVIDEWHSSQALTTAQALDVHLSHAIDVTTAGQEAVFRGGDAAKFRELQDQKKLLRRYLQEELGHPIPGEDV